MLLNTNYDNFTSLANNMTDKKTSSAGQAVSSAISPGKPFLRQDSRKAERYRMYLSAFPRTYRRWNGLTCQSVFIKFVLNSTVGV